MIFLYQKITRNIIGFPALSEVARGGVARKGNGKNNFRRRGKI